MVKDRRTAWARAPASVAMDVPIWRPILPITSFSGSITFSVIPITLQQKRITGLFQAITFQTWQNAEKSHGWYDPKQCDKIRNPAQILTFPALFNKMNTC
jgi:hypothetical protein